MRHIDRNCSIKLLYSYLTNPYHRWYGKTHVFEYWYRQLHQDLGHHGKQHEKRWKPWWGTMVSWFWLSASIWPLTGPADSSVDVRKPHNMHRAGFFGPTPMGARAPGNVRRIKDLEDQRLGATQRFIAAERKRQTDFRFSGPLSHFVCQSLSRKIWPSRRFMGRKWAFLKIFGEYFKGMGTIDLPWFTLQDYFTGRTWRSLA